MSHLFDRLGIENQSSRGGNGALALAQGVELL